MLAELFLVDPGRATQVQLDDLGVLEQLAPRPLEAVGAQVELADLEVLLDRKALEDVVELRHVAEAAMSDVVGAAAADLLASEQDPPAARSQEAKDRLHQGRLAGPIGTDHGHDLTLVDAN